MFCLPIRVCLAHVIVCNAILFIIIQTTKLSCISVINSFFKRFPPSRCVEVINSFLWTPKTNFLHPLMSMTTRQL